jgi:outer membrane protein assembly factor BamB
LTFKLYLREYYLKPNRKWLNHKLPLLIAAVITTGLVAIGCVSGLTPIGWSGGTVSGGNLYVGSNEGRLVAINLADESRQWAETLKPVTQPGLFGCAPTAGGGCGTASPRVAIYGTPVVAGDLVYIAGYNGKIYAYNISNISSMRWVYPREGNLKPFVGGLVEAQGKLFIGGSDGKVYAFDAANGDKLWEFATGEKIWGTPAIDGNTLYIGSFDKKLYAISAADGSKKWEFVTEGAIIATPLVYNGTIYIGSFDRSLYAVNAADGKLKWKFTGKNWFWAQPVVFNDTIYAGCLDGNIYVLKAGSGEKVKEFELKSPVASTPVIMGSNIILAVRDGMVYSIATGSQEIKQIADTKTEIDGPLTAYEGIVYIHTQQMELLRINAASGALLSPVSLKS